MSRTARGFALWLAWLVLAPAWADEGGADESIRWVPELPAAFARAKAEGKILMICVNAKHVTGGSREEPAAKGLREVVYEDPRVVERSHAFVCVLLTAEGTADDYGELRALGIDGVIVSPQHLFVDPEGTTILYRKEFWSYGQGEPAVAALLGMMDKAEAKWKGRDPDAPPPEADDAAPPPDGEERVAWIADLVRQVVERGGRDRARALERLVKADGDGDCTGPLLALLPEHKKDAVLLEAVLRALGRDGLEAAALPIADFLDHKVDSVRANAAVSLEYIGSHDRKVVAALRKASDREKEAAIANHVFRALGRCGAGDAKVRALLLKKAASGKSEFATYGPCLGLAYFDGDEKAMRGVEKVLKQVGIPGSRRGGGQNTVKRGVISWTLASIGDAKSAKFVREELIERLENVQAFWVDGMRRFWAGVAACCDGDASQLPAVVGGVRIIVTFARGGDLGRYGAETRSLMDDARKDRDTSTFEPRGDWLLEAPGTD